jgi:DNA-binding CsgD family transcriptional regulator
VVALDRRADDWLDTLGRLFLLPTSSFPAQVLTTALGSSLGAASSAWNYATRDGVRHVAHTSGPLARFESAGQEWLRSGGAAVHPLLRWYAVTGAPLPQTSARVPAAVADRRSREEYLSAMAVWGAEHQLSVPIPAGRRIDDAIVVTRPDEDFRAEDLALAARLQPLLVALRRQVEVHRLWDDAHAAGPGPPSLPDARGAVSALCLSPRELTVLYLLGEGLTQDAIGRRLQISPRTVHKHVEHVYRKLGVADRLAAVLRARTLGVLPADGTGPRR